MSNTPFNLTIVLPPNRQYYVSYFYPYEFHNNSIYQSKYRSNVTTALEEDWHSADIYNEFWKDNPTKGEPIRGNIYKVPFTFYSDALFAFKACTYFVFSYYENDELKYFVYVMNENGAHTGSFGYSDTDIETYLKKDTDGSLLVYVGFITDYGTQVYAPGRKIGDYTLGINDVLLRGASVDKCADIGNEAQRGKLNNFPDEVLVNGYYIFTSTEGIIDGEYQLGDGYNAGTKVPELINGVLKSGFTLPWAPYANHKYLDTYDESGFAYVYRFKFTETNGKTICRLMHFNVTGDFTGELSSWGDLFIDPKSKELKIWSWVINPELRVLKQLPADTLSAWHELVIPWETYGNLKGFYFDGEYFNLEELCGRILPASFRMNTIPGFSDVDGRLNYVAKDKSKIIDYAAIHLCSKFRPYVMKDNYFDYYEPVLPDEPEPEKEKDLTKYLKNNYYVSNRQEAGTLEYSIDRTKITDIVYVPFITIQEIKNFIRHNELIEGSFFGDINRSDLKFPREMGNLEWVIHALQLNPKIKYTPDSLAAFLHQYDEENTYTTPKVGVYLVVDEDTSTIFDKLTQIFNPTFKHVGLLLLEDLTTI